jgi:hypothetical protein
MLPKADITANSCCTHPIVDAHDTRRPLAAQELCLVHVPKTGGLSVLRSLLTIAGGCEVLLRGPNYATFRSREAGCKVTLIGHDARLAGHMTLARYKREINPGCFAAGVVRHPRDRLVSAFFYLCQGGQNAEDRRDAQTFLGKYRGDFRAFVLDALASDRPALFEQIHLRPQFTWLCDAASALVADYVAHVETLRADFATLLRRFSLPVPELVTVNRSTHSDAGDYYDDETERLVRQAYRRDYELFGYE